MTESTNSEAAGESVTQHCRWCPRVLPVRTGPGRPRLYCSQRCRQWDWVARQRARELDLNENELVVLRDELDRLHDQVYLLACAVDDTERSLQSPGKRSASELDELVGWLLDAARPLRDIELSAS